MGLPVLLAKLEALETAERNKEEATRHIELSPLQGLSAHRYARIGPGGE